VSKQVIIPNANGQLSEEGVPQARACPHTTLIHSPVLMTILWRLRGMTACLGVSQGEHADGVQKLMTAMLEQLQWWAVAAKAQRAKM